MIRFLFLLSAYAFLLVLGGCTGSFEPPNPILLVTGYQDGTGAKVALIRDNLGVTEDRPARLEFIPGSVEDLPAPAVSYDITNREEARGTLVVLSRAPAAGGSATAYLSFFSLRGINPDAPTAFDQPREPLVISPATVEIVPDLLVNPRFCPSSVQVTHNGTFAAVLNEPLLCRGTEQPSIDIFALQGERIRLLQRITRAGGFLVQGGGIYLSQSPTQDLLYYAVNAGTSLRLQRATLPRPGSTFGPDDQVSVDLVAQVRQRAAWGNLVDLGRAGPLEDERLVVLFEEALVSVSGFTDEGEAGGAIETPRNNARVIRDDLRRTDAALLLATRAPGRFSYVPVLDAEDEAEAEVEVESERVNAVDAVIVPNEGYVYFVGRGANRFGEVFLQVSLFDLSSYDAGEPLPNPTANLLPELPDVVPSFITWTPAALPAPAP